MKTVLFKPLVPEIEFAPLPASLAILSLNTSSLPGQKMFYPPMSCFHAVDGVVCALTKHKGGLRRVVTLEFL